MLSLKLLDSKISISSDSRVWLPGPGGTNCVLAEALVLEVLVLGKMYPDHGMLPLVQGLCHWSGPPSLLRGGGVGDLTCTHHLTSGVKNFLSVFARGEVIISDIVRLLPQKSRTREYKTPVLVKGTVVKK